MENRETLLFYTIALTQIPFVGKLTQRRLLSRFRSAKLVFEAAFSEKGESDFNFRVFQSIRENRDKAFRVAEHELKYAKENNYRVFVIGDESYPYRLQQCPDSPLVFYGKGNLTFNANRVLAVVGSRSAGIYGIDATKRFVEEISCYNPVVVSGLALGVDATAHETALLCGLQTQGVLGHGLKYVYPSSHKKLYEKILENGGIISEYTFETPPLAINFPPRNRIIAGLSDAIVVTEARERSGALITANLAFSYSRDVFAFPGRITDVFSAGCNNLIKKNKAALITSAADVADAMQWENITQKQVTFSIPFDLTENEQRIYDIINPCSAPDVDYLLEYSGFTISELSEVLLSLECKSVIKSLPGKRYQRK